jgi:ectoine hydroxylase-related dioxygenase (phytanoyl-CoA dioxygenase family)
MPPRTALGWNEAVAPVAGSDGTMPEVATWSRRRDDRGVLALRAELEQHNGLDLAIVAPEEVERACVLLKRDGFVCVRDALPAPQLARMRAATEAAIDEIDTLDPGWTHLHGGLPHRFSFGGLSMTRHRMHVPEWTELIDVAAVSRILTAVWGGEDYLCVGGGGDVCLPGAVEYQHLHNDIPGFDRFSDHQPAIGPATTSGSEMDSHDLPTPMITVNFAMCDLTWENGPIRQIPGTHTSKEPIPRLGDEPEWMKYTALVGVPAGSAIIRDCRCWVSFGLAVSVSICLCLAVGC